jgi:hypothetical protein
MWDESLKPETRNPKEGRKPETRNPKRTGEFSRPISDFGFGISFGFLVSGFGFDSLCPSAPVV